MLSERFHIVIDSLYGAYKLGPLVRMLAVQPEVQRLRGVRLSNIDSLFLPGSANISRYEHSLGVAYLASRSADALELSFRDRSLLECAALLHDVGITPFGHLMEEAFRWAGIDFDHERRLKEVFSGGEVGNVDAPIFRGRPAGVRRVLHRKEFRENSVDLDLVLKIKAGQGPLGALLNGTIDIDNIDNVCRMAYHIGMSFRRNLGIELVRCFSISGSNLCFDEAHLPLVREWLRLRERLYDILMTNPVDFVAKAMMIEAMRLALTGDKENPATLQVDDWKLTDSELVTALLRYQPSAILMDRLLRGDLFGLIDLCWIEPGSTGSGLLQPPGIHDLRARVAECLGLGLAELFLYAIKDKRVRRIDNLHIQSGASSNPAIVSPVGESPRRYLVGACTSTGTHLTSKYAQAYHQELCTIFGQQAVSFCDSAASLERAMTAETSEQSNLF